MKIHENSMLALKVCKKLIDFSKVSYEEAQEYVSKMTVPKEFCPYAQEFKCNQYSKYRTYDGSCNNLVHPWLGKSETPLKRLYPSRYSDFMNEPVYKSLSGKLLTNPRTIALKVHFPSDVDISVNTLFVFWGQFLDHDLSMTGLITGPDGKPKACTCDSKDPDCLNIQIPANDPVYKDQKCMVTPRSSASFPKYNCKLGSREQINLLSHWLDLSQVYGITKEDNAKIRLGKDGLLKASSIPGIRYEHLPLAPKNSSSCQSEKQGSPCFMGTETRLNQNLALMGVHTVMLREHNRIARSLKYMNSRWSDEKVFQETRRLLIAMYQHIVYKDWVPIVIGRKMADFYDCSMSSYNDYFYGYDKKTNPHISNEFATAAFRFGHTLITSYVIKADTALNTMSNMSLADHFLNTKEAFKDYGVDGVLRGTLRQKSTANDGHFTSVINDHLFRNPDKNAETKEFSLSALNINRGRDHALPTYTAYRKLCGLGGSASFNDMDYMHKSNLNGMKSVYENIDDMDLFTGGISEKPVEGGLVGPVFASKIFVERV
jgi:peroxidase